MNHKNVILAILPNSGMHFPYSPVPGIQFPGIPIVGMLITSMRFTDCRSLAHSSLAGQSLAWCALARGSLARGSINDRSLAHGSMDADCSHVPPQVAEGWHTVSWLQIIGNCFPGLQSAGKLYSSSQITAMWFPGCSSPAHPFLAIQSLACGSLAR